MPATRISTPIREVRTATQFATDWLNKHTRPADKYGTRAKIAELWRSYLDEHGDSYRAGRAGTIMRRKDWHHWLQDRGFVRLKSGSMVYLGLRMAAPHELEEGRRLD